MIPVRGSRFSEEDRYISDEIVRQARHEGGATSFLFVAVLCGRFRGFHFGAGRVLFPENMYSPS